MPVFTGVRARRRRSAEREGRREFSRRRSLRGAAEENLLRDGSSNQAQHSKNTAGLLSCRVFVYSEQFGCLYSQEFARGGGGARRVSYPRDLRTSSFRTSWMRMPPARWGRRRKNACFTMISAAGWTANTWARSAKTPSPKCRKQTEFRRFS